jgi:hypothetical protein
MAGEERLWPIERLVGGIDELRTVLGTEVGPAVDRVKAELVAAMAARDRGQHDAALLAIARGMGELASLGDRLGAAEGEMMRAVTSAFIGGMACDDREAVERNLKAIESRAGTPRKSP